MKPMNPIQPMFDQLREDITDVKTVKHLDEHVLSALWTTSIFSTMEAVRKNFPEYTEWEIIEEARKLALQHFDVTLLAAHGVFLDES